MSNLLLSSFFTNFCIILDKSGQIIDNLLAATNYLLHLCANP